MAQKLWDNFPKYHLWFQRIVTAIGVVYVLSDTIIKSLAVSTDAERYLWIAVGIAGAIVIALIHLGFLIWNRTFDWLTIQLQKYSRIRQGIIICQAIIICGIAGGLVFFVSMDNLLKAIIAIFFLLLAPSAIATVLGEDRRRERFALIGNHLTPAFIELNPQAAIEHAFTLFEDHLRKRLGVGADVYGEHLINTAYGQDGKLEYGVAEGEKRGVRNLLSGAYAVFRNPRKHRVVVEDKLTALGIITTVELLMHIVDDSTDKSLSL